VRVRGDGRDESPGGELRRVLTDDGSGRVRFRFRGNQLHQRK
jgi:hypothetical protein